MNVGAPDFRREDFLKQMAQLFCKLTCNVGLAAAWRSKKQYAIRYTESVGPKFLWVPKRVYYISEELRFQLIHPSHAAKSAGVRIGRLAMAKALCNILKNAFRGGIVHPPLATHRTAVRMLSRRLIADVAVKLPLYFVAKSLFAVVRVPPLACCAFVFVDC